MSTNLAIWSKRKVGKVDAKLFDRVERKPVYTTSHPRSGATWTNRLLSDALNAGLQVQPGHEVQFWGDGWHSNYVIRKTHSRSRLPGPTVYIQRDPRAAIVSAMHYRRIPTMREMLKGREGVDEFKGLWDYESFVRAWLPLIRERKVSYVTYEALHDDGANELRRITRELTGEVLTPERAQDVYERQRFAVALSRLGDPHSMWKGEKWHWRKVIDRQSGELIHRHLGGLMMELGYVKNEKWLDGLEVEV